MTSSPAFRLLDRISTKGQGARANEDAIGFGSRCATVVDGATSLDSTQSTVSIGGLLAKTICSAASRLCGEYATAGWDVWLGRVLVEAALEMRAEIGEVPSSAHPSAAAAFVQLSDNHRLDYCLFGDCVMAVRESGRPTEVFSDERLDRLDAIAIGILQEEILRTGDIEVARQTVMPVLRRHRNMMNTPEGYPALTLDGAGLRSAVRGTLTLSRGSRILLASDGLVQAAGLFELVAWDDLVKGSVTLSEAELSLRREQEQDSQCTMYPRLKKGDDATGLLLEIV